MGTEIDRLEIQIQAQAQKANAQLDELVTKLSRVESSLNSMNSKGLNQLANGVTRLSSAMNTISSVKTADFTRLAKNIDKLGNIDSNSLYKVSSSISTLTNALNSVGSLSQNSLQIGELASSIAKLGHKGTSSAITNLPLLASALNNLITTLSKAPAVSSNVIQLTNSIANLASQGSRVRSVTNAVSSSMNKATTSTNKYADANYRAHKYSSTLLSKITKLTAAFFALKNIVGTLWGSIEKSMDYGETINLFQTSFKKIGLEASEKAGYQLGTTAAESYAIAFSNKAEDFAEFVSDKLSLDPNLTKNYQALFAQMSNSMGLVSESAYNMSAAFTVLGNDMASLWNIDTSSAMEKLQSGLSGQIRPLRELGIDISETSLKLTAKNYGIDDSIEKMSAAAKVQLRWLSIMDQTTVAWGDMAKTLESPSNQLRILKQQWDNLCRSIGSVFLPLMQTILPYVNGFLIALRNITDAFATMMGYELPDYTDSDIFTGVVDGVGDVEEGANDATSSIEKLKKATAGFDELTILNPNSGTSKTDSGSGYPVLDDAIADKTTNYLAKFQEELGKMSNQAEKIANIIQPKIEGIFKVLGEMTPVIAGVASAFATYKIVGLFGSLADKLALFNPTVGIVALTIGALVALGTAVYKAWQEAKKGDLEKRFGDIKLSLEEVEEVANRITDNGTLELVATVKSEWDTLDGIKVDIEENVKTLDKLNWKVSLGLELTESEQEQYKTAILEYIAKSEEYIDQERLAVLMSIDLLISDSETKKNMMESSNLFYNSSKAELESLGKQLNETVNAAWADGLLEIPEAEKVAEIQQSMANIMQQLASSEFEAKMQLINMNFSGIKLTPDSFKKVMEESQKLIDEAVTNYDEVTLNLLASVNAQYKAGTINTKEWERQIEAIKLGKLSNLGEITLNATKFNLNTLVDGFEVDLDGKAEEFQSTLEKFVNSYLTTDDIEYSPDAWNNFFSQIDGAIEGGFNEVKGPAGENLKDFVEDLQPTKRTLESIAKQYTEMGQTIPESVSNGLTSITYLEAITEDTDAIFALVANTLNSSDEYSKLLSKAEEMGVTIPEWVNGGVKIGIPTLTNGISGLINSINTTLTTKTQTVAKNAKENGNKVVTSYNSAFTNDKSSEKTVIAWVGKTDKGIRDTLGIDKSGKTSTLGSSYGKFLVQGFNSGIENNSVSTSNTIGNWANTFMSKFKTTLGINSPSRVFKEFGGFITEGLDEGIEKGMGSTETVLDRYTNLFNEWGNGIALSDITASAGLNYTVNTSGIAGYSALMDNATLTMNAMKSGAKSSGSAMTEDALYRVMRRVMDETTLGAVISDKEVFNSTRKMNKEHKRITGESAFI